MFEGMKGRKALQVAVLSVALVGTTVPPAMAQGFGNFFVTWQARSLSTQVNVRPENAARRIDRIYSRNNTRAVAIGEQMSFNSLDQLGHAFYARNPVAARAYYDQLVEAGVQVSPWGWS